MTDPATRTMYYVGVSVFKLRKAVKEGKWFRSGEDFVMSQEEQLAVGVGQGRQDIERMEASLPIQTLRVGFAEEKTTEEDSGVRRDTGEDVLFFMRLRSFLYLYCKWILYVIFLNFSLAGLVVLLQVERSGDGDGNDDWDDDSDDDDASDMADAEDAAAVAAISDPAEGAGEEKSAGAGAGAGAAVGGRETGGAGDSAEAAAKAVRSRLKSLSRSSPRRSVLIRKGEGLRRGAFFLTGACLRV